MGDAALGWLTILALTGAGTALVTVWWRYQAFRHRNETPEERRRREQREAMRHKEAGPNVPG